MLFTLLLYGMFLCPALIETADTGKAKPDLDRMQGTWVLHALEINGKDVGQKQLENTVLIIKGDKYVTKVKDNEQPGFRLKLDPTKDPKAIDMIRTSPGGDEVIKGIYSLENDTLKICRGLSADQERPRQLATWPNTNYFVVTWRKQSK
ncbi:MAG: TIGR03067 domain-containing protein [Planctomycetes bacterium]|nr:TIGR03067 domain-containing protein [Planctomycetota bacterium]